MRHIATTTDQATLPASAVGAAHDLRNVLFVISAHCHRLLQASHPGDRGIDEVHSIKAAAERGMALARQMVVDGEPMAGPPLVDINRVMAGIEPLLRRLVGDTIAIDLRLAPGATAVHATATQIEQIVMNLAVNARDAMPEGGILTIATEPRLVPSAGRGQASQFLVLSLTDTGIGMDTALQERIFEPYFTTKGNDGTGIGLATIRSIAHASGGHVEVSSAPGRGTTMRVVLPRAEEPIARVPQPLLPTRESAVPAAETMPLRVLLVEDEAVVRELLQRWLAFLGHTLIVATSGVDGLDRCAPGQPDVDLVITDLHMPGFKGTTLARGLRERRPDVPMVFMSGESEALRPLARLDRCAVLTKPFSLAELTDAVNTAVHGSAVLARP